MFVERETYLDSFFTEEWGLEYKDGSNRHLNRYTRLFRMKDGLLEEISHDAARAAGLRPANLGQKSGTLKIESPNPLDPSATPKVAHPESIEPPDRGASHSSHIYVPQKWRDAFLDKGAFSSPLRVIVWFGVGDEHCRQGLRSFIDRLVEPTALIVRAGVEEKTKWGVGITEAAIDDLIQKALTTKKKIPTLIETLVAYSTGNRGLWRSIQNGLFPLNSVKRVVLIDCLYAHVDLAQEALTLLQKKSPTVKVIAYVSSADGSPAAFDKGVQLPETKWKVKLPLPGIVNLFGSWKIQALTYARVLRSALDEQQIRTDELDKQVLADLELLNKSMPARGKLISSANTFKWAYDISTLPAGTTTLDAWVKPIEAEAKRFKESLTKKPGKTLQEPARLIWERQLPGWNGARGKYKPGSLPAKTLYAAGVHDFLPFELAWEYLGRTV